MLSQSGVVTVAMRILPLARRSGKLKPPALWPMLADADGRWLGADNAATFLAFAEQVRRETGAAEIVLDLEPPIAALKAALAMRCLPLASDATSFRRAREGIVALVTRLHDAGTTVSAAVPPPVLFDELGGKRAWQRCLGTPVDGIAWDHVSPMLYASILEGWSRPLLRREDARAFVAWGCRATVARFGSRVGASIGAVGTGALGDEPVYRSPAELAEDVAVARAGGVDNLALFELGGVLRRPPADAWLEAFTVTEPAKAAPSTLRTRPGERREGRRRDPRGPLPRSFCLSRRTSC